MPPVSISDGELASLLGRAKPAWDTLVAWMEAREGLAMVWKFYGAKHGWQLKFVDARKRSVLYMIPREGRFGAALALRDDAIAALPAAGVAPDVVRAISQAKPSTEGRPARVEVTGARDLALVKELVTVKLGAPAATRSRASRR